MEYLSFDTSTNTMFGFYGRRRSRLKIILLSLVILGLFLISPYPFQYIRNAFFGISITLGRKNDWSYAAESNIKQTNKYGSRGFDDFSASFQGPQILPMKIRNKTANQVVYTGDKTTVFAPNELYSRTRVPALIYAKDHFLAFCEGRVHGIQDFGEMDILMRRGVRKGLTVEWEKNLQIVAHIPNKRTMNPSPVYDRERNAIILIFITVLPNVAESDMMKKGVHQVSVMMMRSYDLGLTWTRPINISNQTVNDMKLVPASYFTGPGHSIQTKSGRIVVPGYVWVRNTKINGLPNQFHNCVSRSNVIYSDDGGDSWSLGGFVPSFDYKGKQVNSNEAQVVDLGDGALCVNSRTINSLQTRYWSCSYNGGQSFRHGRLTENLHEPGYRIIGGILKSHTYPGCQGSTLGFPIYNNTRNGLIFSNPASLVNRMFLSIRLSLNSGRSWSKPLLLDHHFAGYTDLTYFQVEIEGESFPAFGILYEHGVHQECETIDFKIFTLGFLVINNESK